MNALHPNDIALVLAVCDIPPDVGARLAAGPAEPSELSDCDLLTLNDACLARIQEHGWDEAYESTREGAQLERVVGWLNQ